MLNTTARSRGFALVAWTACALWPCAALAGGESKDDWQMQMLFEPTPEQLRIETQRDRVFIYSRVKDTDINRAMDEQFPRVQHMMFVNTLVVQKKPQPNAGEPSGPVVVEQHDGCD
jgi:hypothetical protein